MSFRHSLSLVARVRSPAPFPPPYHADAENCIPLPDPEFAGPGIARERVASAPHEERQACLFVKRILGAPSQPSEGRRAC